MNPSNGGSARRRD